MRPLESADHAEFDLKEFSVLLVEDEEVCMKSTTYVLCSMVKELHWARDGREGYYSFAKHDPDIIVTDIVMPKMDGLEMARAIRLKKPETPIVFVTSFSDSDFLRHAIELKVDGFVLKPVRPEALLETLNKCARALRHSQELAERKRLNDLMIDFLPHPAMLINGARRVIIKANNSAAELGYADGFPCQGELFPEVLFAPFTLQRGKGIRSFERVRMEEVNAHERVWEVTLTPINEQLLFFNAVDVTQRKLTEMALECQASIDELTRLPNRFVLLDRLERALSQTKRYGSSFAVLYVDLDYFKQVNDSMGHGTGDKVLQQAAARIAERVRDSDTVARLGGDEFCVLLHNLKSAADSEAVARSIIDALRRPFTVEDRQWRLGASVGISICPQDGLSAEELLRKADAAMYRAKAAGRNAACFFSTQD